MTVSWQATQDRIHASLAGLSKRVHQELPSIKRWGPIHNAPSDDLMVEMAFMRDSQSQWGDVSVLFEHLSPERFRFRCPEVSDAPNVDHLVLAIVGPGGEDLVRIGPAPIAPRPNGSEYWSVVDEFTANATREMANHTPLIIEELRRAEPEA